MKKRVVDIAIICVCASVFAVALLYPEQVSHRSVILWIAGILSITFMVFAVRDNRPLPEADLERPRASKESDTKLITEIALLNEEDTELSVWELYGKTTMVIGRDVKENQVDIDLGRSPYASMVDIEHAVLNYASGNWYIEDLGSKNGISVKKAEDGKLYRLSSDTPCRLERGDCLQVGLNRLLLR